MYLCEFGQNPSLGSEDKAPFKVPTAMVRGWDTLIFTYIRRLRPFFWVHNFEFQYFLGFSEKMNVVLGMKSL